MAGRMSVWFILGLILIGTVAASNATGVVVADHDRRVLFKDNFNRYPEGSDGSPVWVSTGGVWRVEDNEFSQSAMNYIYYSVAGDPSWTDYSVEVKVRIVDYPKPVSDVTPPDTGLVFRWSAEGDSWYTVQLCVDGRLRLYRKDKGSTYPTPLFASEVCFKWKKGEEYELKVRAVGGRITVYLDSDAVIRFVDTAPLLSGKIGFFCGYMHSHYDDVVVRAIRMEKSESKDMDDD